MTGLYSLADLSPADVLALADRSVQLHRDRTAHDRPLTDLVVGTLFTKTSTRTRTAFTTAALRLGASVVAFGPDELQTATGESTADTGRVLASMLDGLVVRTAGPVARQRELSGGGVLPVVNAMSREEHPTQGLTDLAVLRHHFGDLAGVRVLYVGEGNNTAAALVHALAAVPGCELVLACPKGYGPRDPGPWREVADLAEVTGDVDVVYTTRWQTTGTAKADPDWREAFRPFHVDTALMDRWPDAVFLHDLPAHRGEEVAGAVLDGARSLAWTQAAMKAASAMAVLERFVGGRRA
ncbi:ornithine carbamoyltransferase [Saccharothrix sp. NPDC042600]|uniref:CmnL n=2 Tax=Saccharothrix mutabilis TaxID=33921 RepID=A6YEI3_STRMP|nr:CmnL [Saccharothrix mutabilis subsp. capreolus]BFE50446.1 ornithine carbamoyltransferase [Saccharothrix mutabilis subsp. capreolus]